MTRGTLLTSMYSREGLQQAPPFGNYVLKTMKSAPQRKISVFALIPFSTYLLSLFPTGTASNATWLGIIIAGAVLVGVVVIVTITILAIMCLRRREHQIER